MLTRKESLELDRDFRIEVTDLTVKVGADIPLRGVSVEFIPGEYAAIIGASGSGKTTLANYVLGLSIENKQPQKGSVKYDDFSIYDLSESDRAFLRGRYFGYVPQRLNLQEGMSARSNVALASRLKGLKVDRKLIDYYAEVIGIAPKLDKEVGTLSGGEQQRVSILRALAHNPSVLVLDEPTSALNQELKEETNIMLSNLASSIGKTVLVVTHESTSAKRIIKLDSGRIVSDTSSSRGQALQAEAPGAHEVENE